jgi:squalene-hopene/tetraprenyl-beta-curcumene cyclase
MYPQRFCFGVLFFAAFTTACSRPQTKTVTSSWSPKTAAAYLDYRASWWMQWNGAARDHGTFCISCHTALPYALARPVLSNVLSEPYPSPDEQRIVEDVQKRVRLWKEIGPYYSDQGYDHKTAESRGTESVLNALILAAYDSQQGQLSNDTRAAFDNMWALQQNTGAWQWLQFDQEPWEANDSAYFGATVAAIAVGTAPGNYQAAPEIQDNLKLLREYLNRKSAAQSTINRVCLLWASTKLRNLLNSQQQKAIIEETLSRQQADGGWRLASIAWRWNGWSLKTLLKMWLREDGTPLEGKSDGVATGLITFVLQEAGVPRQNPQLSRGLFWLMSNQNTAEGSWPASSVNKKKNLTSDTGRFMSDAATAYAVLALTENQRNARSVAAVSSRR